MGGSGGGVDLVLRVEDGGIGRVLALHHGQDMGLRRVIKPSISYLCDGCQRKALGKPCGHVLERVDRDVALAGQEPHLGHTVQWKPLRVMLMRVNGGARGPAPRASW